jgi:hypothetical protein
VKYAQQLSARAVKNLDALDDKAKKRMLDRIAELAARHTIRSSPSS